jgi:iron-regulated transporter 1
MPRLEKLIGLERAGAWSIWFEAVCLTPALIAFFYGLGPYGQHGKTWNSVLLFGGIALSRIGLWSFDLCQVSFSLPVMKLPDGIAQRTPNRSCRSP